MLNAQFFITKNFYNAQHLLNKNMANAELAKYIKTQQKAGYNLQQIKQILAKQGYARAQIDAATRQAGFPVTRIAVRAAIVVIILIIIALTILVFLKMQAPEEKIKIPAEKTEKEPGKIPEKPIETGAPEEKTKIELDKIPVPPADQIIPEGKEDIDFDSSTIIDEARETSFTDVERAARMCNDLETTKEKDACFIEIAQSASKPNLCANINEIIIRDQCYFYFATQHKNTCNKISNEMARKSCEQMLSLNITA